MCGRGVGGVWVCGRGVGVGRGVDVWAVCGCVGGVLAGRGVSTTLVEYRFALIKGSFCAILGPSTPIFGPEKIQTWVAHPSL